MRSLFWKSFLGLEAHARGIGGLTLVRDAW